MAAHPPRIRFVLMAAGVLALVAGLAAGLVRIGWPLPLAPPALDHGPLMVSVFLGTLIGVERAVALGRRWAWSAPALSAAAGIVLVIAPRPLLAAALTGGAAVVLTLVLVQVTRRQPALFTVTMTAGAAAWLVGNVRWMAGVEISELVSWWMAFPLLTIAGERLEMSRLVPVRAGARAAFHAVLVVLVAALVAGGVSTPAGSRLLGVALVALAAWLARHDVARRTVRVPGLPRYAALCLLSGYAWLAVAGVLTLVLGPVVAGPAYDAVLHAVFVGFVFAMIFGHAPIIFPAVLGVAVPFTRALYLPLALLHAALALRVVGDVLPASPLRAWGGLLGAVAIVAFLAGMVCSALAARRKTPLVAARTPAQHPAPTYRRAAGRGRSL